MAEVGEAAFRQYNASSNVYPANLPGNGIDPFLVAGLPVPMMSTVLIYLPLILASSGRGFFPYQFSLYWRMRAFDTQASDEMRPFHARNSTFGPDNPGRFQFSPQIDPPGGSYAGGMVKRDTAIVAVEPLRYVLAQPADEALGPGMSNIRQSVVVPIGDNSYVSPLFPPLAGGQNPLGQMGQGIAPDSLLAGAPSHIVQTTMAKGDELIVLLRREAQDGLEEWDFAPGGADYVVSAFLGRGLEIPATTPQAYQRVDAGVFVSTGLAP